MLGKGIDICFDYILRILIVGARKELLNELKIYLYSKCFIELGVLDRVIKFRLACFLFAGKMYRGISGSGNIRMN